MNKPDLGFWKLWNLSFGFFGVQIAYALQSAQVSRIFSTIGADPHDLSYFWILPPLMGLIVQPIVGSASDRTWNRFGRRLPYLLIGAAAAIIVMCFLPNAGSLGLSVSSAIIFGLVMLMFLDTSINMAMQPFKMLVGDFVNEKQKGLAYSIQSFLCNAGSVVGYVCPIILAMFMSNTAADGEVPATVTWSFYIGAAVLLLCVVYTFAKVKEMPPAQYAAYHGIDPAKAQADKKKGPGMFRLLARAPKVFWTVGLVQFFCWAAFLFMWSYSTDAIANHVFHAPSVIKVDGISINGTAYTEKYVLAQDKPVVADGKLSLGGIIIDGNKMSPTTVINASGDTVVAKSEVVYVAGVAKVAPQDGCIADAGDNIVVDGKNVCVNQAATTFSALSQVKAGEHLQLAHIYSFDKTTNKYVAEQTEDIPYDGSTITTIESTVLNAASKEYQDAGDWNGVLLAIQAIAALLWAAVLSQFRNRRLGYSLSLLIGAIGFMSVFFVTDQYILGICYALMGCAWAAMLAMPFTILTNALGGDHIGTYLGLFNCTICIPQIVAAIFGGMLLGCFAPTETGTPNTVLMLVSSGILLLLGSLAVWNVKETYGSKNAAKDLANTNTEL